MEQTTVVGTGDPGDVLDRASGFLAEDPVERNLAASQAATAVGERSLVRCWIGRVGDRVTGLLVQTDPERFGLVFGSSRAAAVALGHEVAGDAPDLPAVRGEVGVAVAFAGTYATVTGRPGHAVDAHLRAGRIGIWTDGATPMAMGFVSRVAFGVSRIGGIYTTPDRRGSGYGAAVTAAITAEQLSGEATICMLYTQLSSTALGPSSDRCGAMG